MTSSALSGRTFAASAPAVLFSSLFILVALSPVSARGGQNPAQPSCSFENGSLDVLLGVKEGGAVRAEASFRGAKPAYRGKFPLGLFPVRRGNLKINLSRSADAEMKVDVSVRGKLVENSLSPKIKFGLTLLNSMSVRDINEKCGPVVKKTFSKVVGSLEPETEDIEATDLENFRVTSFKWTPPVLEASAEMVFRHPRIEKLDLPVYFKASGEVKENAAFLEAFLTASHEGPGLEKAALDMSLFRGKTGIFSRQTLRFGEGWRTEKGRTSSIFPIFYPEALRLKSLGSEGK